MSYNVFKDRNNNLITAPNETGEIVLKTSIPRQIRIEVDRNSYKFYDIIEKKYLSLSEIKDINPEKCIFTAIIYPCGEILRPELVAVESNYRILYKFVDSCLGATFSTSHINSYNGKYSSNNIYFNINSTTNPNLSNPITIEFEFQLGVKIRLNLSPSGSDSTSTFYLASDDIEIISLFKHNITIDANYPSSRGSYAIKYIFSLSFSLINNRYEPYTKDQMSSMIEDLPQNKRYPASGLLYVGTYSYGDSTMSIAVYTIKYIYTLDNNNLSMAALFTDKKSGLSSSTTVDNTFLSFDPDIPLYSIITFTDDVVQLS